jgi:hypothetical protein
MTGNYGFKPSFNQTFVMPDRRTGWVGHAVSLRHRSRTGRADDRELPDRPTLEHHALLPDSRQRAAKGGIYGPLALAEVSKER